MTSRTPSPFEDPLSSEELLSQISSPESSSEINKRQKKLLDSETSSQKKTRKVYRVPYTGLTPSLPKKPLKPLHEVLPVELWLHIFSYFHEKSQIAALLTLNKHLYPIIQAALLFRLDLRTVDQGQKMMDELLVRNLESKVHSLRITKSFAISSPGRVLLHVETLKHTIRHLDIHSLANFDIIDMIPNLETLMIRGQIGANPDVNLGSNSWDEHSLLPESITLGHVRQILDKPRIHNLHLSGIRISHTTDLENYTPRATIHRLTLGGCQFTDNTLQALLAALRPGQVRFATIFKCRGFTVSNMLAHVARYLGPSVQELEISTDEIFTDVFMNQSSINLLFPSLRQIKRLTLRGSCINKACFSHIPPTLEFLEIEHPSLLKPADLVLLCVKISVNERLRKGLKVSIQWPELKTRAMHEEKADIEGAAEDLKVNFKLERHEDFIEDKYQRRMGVYGYIC